MAIRRFKEKTMILCEKTFARSERGALIETVKEVAYVGVSLVEKEVNILSNDVKRAERTFTAILRGFDIEEGIYTFRDEKYNYEVVRVQRIGNKVICTLKTIGAINGW